MDELSDKTRNRAAAFTRARAYGWRAMLYGGPTAALTHHMSGGNWKVTAPLAATAAALGATDKRISEMANTDHKLKARIAQHRADSPTGLAEGTLAKVSSVDEMFPGQHRWADVAGLDAQFGPARRVGPTAEEASSLLRQLFRGR